MNAIIQEIHSAFSSAESILTDRLEREERMRKQIDPEKLKSIAALGFTATREVKMSSPQEQAKAKELRMYVDHYRLHYPGNKFITEDAVTEICKKYGLVHAPVSCYTDSIPSKNMDEIISFKVMKEDLEGVEYQVTGTWNGSSIKGMDNNHLVNTFRYIDKNFNRIDANARIRVSLTNIRSEISRREFMTLSLMSEILYEMFSRTVIREKDIFDEFLFQESHAMSSSKLATADNRLRTVISSPDGISDTARMAVIKLKEIISDSGTVEMTIVAAKHMLNLTGYVVDPLTYKAEKSKPVVSVPMNWFKEDDPIVLCKVKGGYIIVSAWGPEASDEVVFNETMN